LTLWPSLPEAKALPSGEKARQITLPWCPVSSAFLARVSASHKKMEPW
jgi:hypothetical protein